MEQKKITGSCLCGAVRYEITGAPVWAHNCHCGRCRKIRGAAFASNLFVPLDAFRYTEREDLLRCFKLPEAERFTHAHIFVTSKASWFTITDALPQHPGAPGSR